MGPSGRGRGSFGEIGPETRCYRRVLLRDTCRIPPSPPARIVLHKVRAYAATTSPQPVSAGRPLRLRARSGGGVPSADASVRKRLKRQKEQREGETSLLFTPMPQCSSLRRGRTRGPYRPICCPCLCVSQLISLTKSGIIFQLSFIPSFSLPFPVCLFLYLFLSLIYQGALSLSSMFEKGARAPQLCRRFTKHAKMSVRRARRVHKISIVCVKYRLFRRCFMKMRIRTCLKHTDDKSSLSFN